MYAAQIAQLEALSSAYAELAAFADDQERKADLNAHGAAHRIAADNLKVRQRAMEAKLGPIPERVPGSQRERGK